MRTNMVLNPIKDIRLIATTMPTKLLPYLFKVLMPVAYFYFIAILITIPFLPLVALRYIGYAASWIVDNCIDWIGERSGVVGSGKAYEYARSNFFRLREEYKERK